MDLVAVEREGNVLSLRAPAGMSFLSSQRTIGDAVWLTANAYTAGGLYKCVYVEVRGDEARVTVEDQGLLPTLFEGPDGAAWAIVTNPYGEKDVEIIRRVGGAARPSFPPFVGEPVFLDGQVLVLVKRNPFSKTAPDRLMRYDLATDKRKIAKVPLPGNGKYLHGEEGLHAVHLRTHRLLSSTGEVLRERTIDAPELFVTPVELRFDGPSTALGNDLTTLHWLEIEPDGSVRKTKLRDGSFYSLWPPQRTRDGALVVHWVGDGGNGWIVLRDGRVTSATHSTRAGWADDAGAPVVTLPEGNWVLAGVSAVGRDVVIAAYEKDAKGGPVFVARVAV